MNLQNLLEKKKSAEPLDDTYKGAKMSMLQALHDEMRKMMAAGMQGGKQVSVAAPDKEGLAKGLEMAKDAVGGGGAEDADDGSDMGDMGKEPSLSSSDSEDGEDEEGSESPAEDLSPEEIDDMIAHLQALKKSKSPSHDMEG